MRNHRVGLCGLGGVLVAICIMLAQTTSICNANEGMWLSENPPRQLLKSQCQFDCNDAWIKHLRRSSVRFNNGGSGSFCSADGLVITNHHVGADAVYKLSSEGNNLLKNGFYAPTRDQELPCHDLELNVLYEVEDVTARVQNAVKAAEATNAVDARRAVIAEIEQNAANQSGLRCDVVTLYRGGRYHLYYYKKYTDVRLVFAPEQQAAFFGGDADNFEYPRYDLDITFFRVYENGQPAHIDDFLTWNPQGTQEGDLVFVSGHPGHTERLDTVAHLEFLRDEQMPASMASLYRREVLLKAYAGRSPENARRAHAAILGVENGRKARGGMLDGLETPSLFDAKRTTEAKLKEAFAQKYPNAAAGTDPWSQIEKAVAAWSDMRESYELFEGGTAFQSRLFGIARTLVRLAEENEKANDIRLPEYRDSNRASLELSLFSEAPIYADLETLTLGNSLAFALETSRNKTSGLNADAFKWMDGEKSMSPKQFAASLVTGTRLADLAYRKELARGGAAAIAASDDPMIQLARQVDAFSRDLRTRYETTVDEPMKQAYAQLADLQFEVFGDSVYPDATFTLRLAFGIVKGYEENGQTITAYTQLGGVFARHEEMGGGVGDEGAFDLPQRWLDGRQTLDATVPYNFVSTADIIGGNSGSPVVDRAGRFVGIIFDGNIQSLVLDYAFTEEQARATSVDVRAIMETLRKLYHADALLKELALQSK